MPPPQGKSLLAKGGRGVVAAAVPKSGAGRCSRLPAYASRGSVVNANLKAKVAPSPSSELGKFLGLPDPPRSDLSKLVSKFVRLNNPQSPGIKKDFRCEEKLRSVLAGKDKVGAPEIATLLSHQFIRGR